MIQKRSVSSESLCLSLLLRRALSLLLPFSGSYDSMGLSYTRSTTVVLDAPKFTTQSMYKGVGGDENARVCWQRANKWTPDLLLDWETRPRNIPL